MNNVFQEYNDKKEVIKTFTTGSIKRIYVVLDTQNLQSIKLMLREIDINIF